MIETVGQRRREKFAALEAQATSETVAVDTNSSEDSEMAIEVAQGLSVVDMGAFNFEDELLALDFPQEYGSRPEITFLN